MLKPCSLKVNPLHYLIFSPIIITMLSRHTAYPQSKPPPISLLQICSISALSLHKKQSSTYQNRHGRRWFCAVTRLHCKRVGKQCTRTFIVYRACGCFLYAPSIYTAYLQKGLDMIVSSSIILTAHSVNFI